jgi:hypothetical protein
MGCSGPVAVLRRLSRRGRECDQRARGGIDRPEAAEADGARIRDEFLAEWIVTAGVQEQQRHGRSSGNSVQNAIEIDGLVAQVTIRLDVGWGGHQ